MRHGEKTVIRKNVLAMLSGVLLGGCVVTDVPEEHMDMMVGKPKTRVCAATQYRQMIGRSITDIEVTELPRPLRIYSMNSLITQDYRVERLNIVVNTDGQVVNVRCG